MDKAFAEFGTAIARAPKTARFHDHRGRAYKAQNKPDLALALFGGGSD
jgi:hypothetical protein